MPLKREVIALLSSRDDWTRVSGAANTLLLDAEGGRHGLNTDIPGALAAINTATEGPIRSAVVLGGGATAASVLLALAERGLERATLVVRDPARAAETLAAVARHPRPPAGDGDGARRTSRPVVRRHPGLDRAGRGPDRVGDDGCSVTLPVVFDVLYDPWPTPLAAAAAADGRVVVGGLDLLLWQAVDQVRAMTGRFDVPVDAMRRAGEAGLAERRNRAPFVWLGSARHGLDRRGRAPRRGRGGRGRAAGPAADREGASLGATAARGRGQGRDVVGDGRDDRRARRGGGGSSRALRRHRRAAGPCLEERRRRGGHGCGCRRGRRLGVGLAAVGPVRPGLRRAGRHRLAHPAAPDVPDHADLRRAGGARARRVGRHRRR